MELVTLTFLSEHYQRCYIFFHTFILSVHDCGQFSGRSQPQTCTFYGAHPIVFVKRSKGDRVLSLEHNGPSVAT